MIVVAGSTGNIGGALVASPAKLIAAGWTPTVETSDGLAAMARGDDVGAVSM